MGKEKEGKDKIKIDTGAGTDQDAGAEVGAGAGVDAQQEESTATRREKKPSPPKEISLRKARSIVKKIEGLIRSEEISSLNEAGVREKYSELTKRCKEGESLDSLLPETYALVARAIFLATGQNLRSVQLLAAVLLNSGKGAIIEQATGEGKTIAAIPAICLRAMAHETCYLLVPNDNLSQQTAMKTGKVYSMLGLGVGIITTDPLRAFDRENWNDYGYLFNQRRNELQLAKRIAAYQEKIVIATNSVVVYDYSSASLSTPHLTGKGSPNHPLTKLKEAFVMIDEIDAFAQSQVPLVISTEERDLASSQLKYGQLASFQSELLKEFPQLQHLSNGGEFYEVDWTLEEVTLTEKGQTRLWLLINKTIKKAIKEGDFADIKGIDSTALQSKFTQYLRQLASAENSDGWHQVVSQNQDFLFFEQMKTDLANYAKTVLFARHFIKKNKHYYVTKADDGKPQIVHLTDDNRPEKSMRYEEWLQLVIEQRHGCSPSPPDSTFNTYTTAHFLRTVLGDWSGSTGTAWQMREEAQMLYGKKVHRIPTHLQDMIDKGQLVADDLTDPRGKRYKDEGGNFVFIRRDLPDKTYHSREEQYEAIFQEAQEIGQTRPVLINTNNNQEAKELARYFKSKGFKFRLLLSSSDNLSTLEEEIYASLATKPGVTIVAKLASRGTDIELGGNWRVISQKEIREKEIALARLGAVIKKVSLGRPLTEKEKAALSRQLTEKEKTAIESQWRAYCGLQQQEMIKAGGLHIIAVEHNFFGHEDRQLVGRAGRNGCPGSARFFNRKEDSLLAKRFKLNRAETKRCRLAHTISSALTGKGRRRSTIEWLIEKEQKKNSERTLLEKIKKLEQEEIISRIRDQVAQLTRQLHSSDEPLDMLESMATALQIETGLLTKLREQSRRLGEKILAHLLEFPIMAELPVYSLFGKILPSSDEIIRSDSELVFYNREIFGNPARLGKEIVHLLQANEIFTSHEQEYFLINEQMSRLAQNGSLINEDEERLKTLKLFIFAIIFENEQLLREYAKSLFGKNGFSLKEEKGESDEEIEGLEIGKLKTQLLSWQMEKKEIATDVIRKIVISLIFNGEIIGKTTEEIGNMSDKEVEELLKKHVANKPIKQAISDQLMRAWRQFLTSEADMVLTEARQHALLKGTSFETTFVRMIFKRWHQLVSSYIIQGLEQVSLDNLP